MPDATAFYDTLVTPLGELLFTSDGESLTSLRVDAQPADGMTRDRKVLREAVAQVRAYLAKELTAFDLPLVQTGTPFQKTVWAELLRIPYGATVSYGGVAKRIGKPKAYRAVGTANGRNRLLLVVPCHRVIGEGGAIGGYGCGLWRKEWLLAHERE